MQRNNTHLNIRIPQALHAQVESLAEKQMMPMSVLTRLALVEYVKNHAIDALVPMPIHTHTQTNAHTQIAKPIAKPSEQSDYSNDWD
jgi:hypothetical protein